jgi:signal transduction histidine kinase
MDVSNRLKLVHALQSADVRNSAYSVSGALDLALCLGGLENGEWEVFYSERGAKTFSKRFQFVELACSRRGPRLADRHQERERIARDLLDTVRQTFQGCVLNPRWETR